MFMDMDAMCCTFLSVRPILTAITTTSAQVPFSSRLYLPYLIALVSLTLLAAAQNSNNPSTNWSLSEYYPSNTASFSGEMNKSDLPFYSFRFTDFTACNDGNSYMELLSEEKGLYGRTPHDKQIDSAHDSASMPYTVSFNLYFVIPAESICMKDEGEKEDMEPVYYLSLVAVNAYGRSQDPNKGQVVWTANPDKPVSKNACLHLNDSGLALVDYPDMDKSHSSPQVVWQIGTDASNVSLAISFQGNIVLFSPTTNPSNVPLWESFRYPSDTLMVLQVLENESTLTANSSAANYTLAIQNGSLVLYAKLKGEEASSSYGSPYWVWARSDSAFTAISFVAFCWDSENQLRLYAGSDRSSDNPKDYRGMVSPDFCKNITNNNSTTIQINGSEHSWTSATYATFLRLETDGDLHAYTVDNTTYPGSNATWGQFYNLFNNTPCDLPLYCGFYGMCDPQFPAYCTCNYDGSEVEKMVATGFPDTSDPKFGCKLKNDSVEQLWDVQNISGSGQPSTCPNTTNISECAKEDSQCNVQFLSVTNVHYFSLDFLTSYQGVTDSNGCQEECNKSCSCTAAFWNENNGSTSCFLITGRLGTVQKQGTMQAFIKYVKITKIPSPAAPSSSSSGSLAWKVLSPFLAVALVATCIFLVYWRRRTARKLSELEKERSQLLSDLDCSNTERFTWKQMQECTCGFSDLMGGGGFGRVFRGALPDGTAIAVKQLDEDGSQGDKEFVAEVSILSRIHHAHLVRLIGFCLEGNHRLLVYEFIENGSLDAWLFKSHTHRRLNMNVKNKGGELLPWKTRFQIALGTAKGLAYLHEECEERVIHMDLKPQNILLGRGFVAKIADFGLSRRTAREQTSVMTVMKGTPGYLAPEWLVDCAVTEKCDVYSFGIMLLEMVSGRKVKDLRAVKEKLSTRPLRESVMLDLLDESLSNADEEEAVRMVKVALMCVQREPRKRPAMSSVALMLEGKEEVVMQEVADDDDDYGEDAHVGELVMDSSAMKSIIRIEEQQKKLQYSSGSRSLADSRSGNSTNIWWNSDDNNISSSGKLSQRQHSARH